MYKSLSRLKPYLPTALTLIVGVGLSVVAAIAVGRWEYATRQAQFQQQTDNLATALQRSINRYTDILLAIADFYAAAPTEVSQPEFQRFVRRAIASNPGIQALEWAPRISQAERLTYEQGIQAQGYPTFEITERREGQLVRAGDRPEYIPVTYIAPWSGNEVAFGYDLASDETRRLALEAARDTGEIVASGRIRLVQEQKDQFGFLVFLPIYQPFSASIPARRENLRGYILGVFRVADVVEESLQGLSYNIDFYLYDDQAIGTDSHFLGFYDSVRQQVLPPANPPINYRTGNGSLCAIAAHCTHRLQVGQRQWSVLFLPAAADRGSGLTWGAAATVGGGLLLTSSLVFYLVKSQAELARTLELKELKLRFFSMVSHEFRTPLSTVLISAQSLEAHHQEFTEEQKLKIVQRIQSASKRMTQLLSDILTLTRAESGKLEFTPTILNLSQFCEQLVEEVQLSIGSGHLIGLQCDDACTKAYLDGKLLHFILTNLLSNAIKYSPAHTSVDLKVSCTKATIVFQVGDRGIGIPPEAHSHLCETFYRGSNVGDIAGSGLGLAVVKTCIDLHGGNLAIASQLHQGTTITVTLPRIE